MNQKRLSFVMKTFAFLIVLFACFMASATNVRFTFANSQYSVSQYTNVEVILQPEQLNASGSVTVGTPQIYQFTDTNGSTTFSNLAGNYSGGYYHWTVPAFTSPGGYNPPATIQGDIQVVSTNLGTVDSTAIGIVFSPVYNGFGSSWTAQAADLRYSPSSSSLTNYVQIGQLISTSNSIVALIPSTNGIVYSNVLGSAAYVSTNNFDANGVYTNYGRTIVATMTNGANAISASNIDFTIASSSYKRGRVFYDSSQETLAYYNDASAVTVNIGAEQLVRVSNKSGATVLNGSVVYISGAQGQLPTVALAIATNDVRSAIIGMATMDIVNNSTGYITIMGLVNGLDTSSFMDGDVVYLSTTIPGGITTNIPAAPNYAIQVGNVAYSNPSVGKILVNIHMNYTSATNVIGLTNSVLAIASSITNGLGSSAFTSTNQILIWSTNIANSIYSNNPAGYLTGIATNGMTNYALISSFISGTNSVATNDLARLIATNTLITAAYNASISNLNAIMAAATNTLTATKQPASLTLSNLSTTGAFTNQIAAGQNVTISTNFNATIISINATNQLFLTNGITGTAFQPVGYYIATNQLPALTNGFVQSSITNGLISKASADLLYYGISNPSNFLTSISLGSYATTNFVQASILASNANLATYTAVGASNSAALAIATNMINASANSLTNYVLAIGLNNSNNVMIASNNILASASTITNAGNIVFTNNPKFVLAITNASQYQLATNGFAQGFFGLGTKTNFIISTNVISIVGSGSGVDGTYVGNGGNWTNAFFSNQKIIISGGNYYIQTNGVSLYQSSDVINWTLVSGSNPTPSGAFGSRWHMDGTELKGWVYSTNITWQIANAIANATNGGSGTTNFILSGYVTGFTTNNSFSTAGSNSIINLIAQYASSPTNGITGLQATNIAAGLITTATNSLWAGITNRGMVNWSGSTNQSVSDRPATIHWYISNNIPQYGILFTN